jgi:hypothetical protein
MPKSTSIEAQTMLDLLETRLENLRNNFNTNLMDLSISQLGMLMIDRA